MVLHILIFLKASLAMFHMWSYTIKLDEEKSKYANLIQEICFGST
jgi:hypothetical protein